MRTIDYWRAREEEALKQNQKIEKEEYDKQIDEIYQQMTDDCNADIQKFYARYAKKEGITLADAKRKADKLDIEEYGRKAAKYVKEKDFSDQANEEMRLYNMTMRANRLELLKSELALEMTAGTDKYHKLLSKILPERAKESYRRQAGILGKSVPDAKTIGRMMDSVVYGSFKNATFSERIWANMEVLRDKVNRLLVRGLIGGRNPRELARDLAKDMGSSKYDAERLMRTEMARVQIGGQQQAIADAGYDEYMFITVGSAACDACKALDGKIFKLKKMMPGDNAPPLHPNCRCSVAAHIDEDIFRNWLNSGAADNNVEINDFYQLSRNYGYKYDEKGYTRIGSNISYDENYRVTKNRDEIAVAKWLIEIFGGKIKLLTRDLSKPTPDYMWGSKYWDLKTPQSTKGTDKLVHHGLHQIRKNPGGIIVDCSNETVDTNQAISIARSRLKRSGKDANIRIIVKDGEKIVAILK